MSGSAPTRCCAVSTSPPAPVRCSRWSGPTGRENQPSCPRWRPICPPRKGSSVCTGARRRTGPRPNSPCAGPSSPVGVAVLPVHGRGGRPDGAGALGPRSAGRRRGGRRRHGGHRGHRVRATLVRRAQRRERARVALARVLAQRAPLLLLDEPTAALDLRHQELVLRVCRERAHAGDAVVVVLHDLGLAAAYAHRVAILCAGRVAAHGRRRRSSPTGF